MANLPAAIALQRAGLAYVRGDAEQTIAAAKQALAALGEGEWMLEWLTRWHLAVAEWLAGRLAGAEAALAFSIARWRAASRRAPAAAALGYHGLGLVQRDQGRLEAALATYREALAVAAEPDGPAPQIAGVAYTGMAGVLYERGELDAALEYASEGVALCRQLAYTPPLAGALDALGQAERVELSPVVVGLLNPVPAQRARLALAQGDVDAAVGWVRARGLSAQDEPSYPREGEYLMLVRVLLAQQAPERALGLLQPLSASAAAQGRTGSVIEVRALQALARSAGGDQTGALAALAEALVLAAPAGYLRVFVDEGSPMAALLRQLLAGRRQERPAAAGAPQEYLARLVDAFEQVGLPVRLPVRRGGVAVAGLVEPLTARELEVLRLLAAGAPNRAIARQLVVTLDTVKRHLSNLFSKLEVANRTRAARATVDTAAAAGEMDSGSAAEGADQSAAGRGGGLDGLDGRVRAGVSANLSPALEGVDGEPVVMGRAARRARAGIADLAGTVGQLPGVWGDRALGQLGAGRVQADDHPVHIGTPGGVRVVDDQGDLDGPGGHARPGKRRGAVLAVTGEPLGDGRAFGERRARDSDGLGQGALGSWRIGAGRACRQPGQAQHQQPPHRPSLARRGSGDRQQRPPFVGLVGLVGAAGPAGVAVFGPAVRWPASRRLRSVRRMIAQAGRWAGGRGFSCSARPPHSRQGWLLLLAADPLIRRGR
jgi:DNA-binding CsgD family transcriptional regulator/tetratricopeptide (TPR) repeat protein